MTAIVRDRMLRGVPESAGAARRFVRDVAESAGFPAVDDAQICVSELVTNAVTHSLSGDGGGKIRVRVRGVQGGYLRIEVRDDGPADRPPGVPAQLPSPEAEGGRGLFLVSQLARCWGTDRHGLYWCQFGWDSADDGLALAAAGPDQGSLFDLPGPEA